MKLNEVIGTMALIVVVAAAVAVGAFDGLFETEADKLTARATLIEATAERERVENEGLLYRATAKAVLSDTLMSWALVGVLALVAVALLGIVIGAAVVVAWLLREHLRRQDDGHYNRKPTVTS